MKRLKVTILIVVLLAVCAALLACDNSGTIPPPPPERFSVVYTYSEGGSVDGILEQEVIKGDDSLTVTAIPNEGYLFAGWSDGKYSEERQDKNITSDYEITANFVSNTKTFNYEYNNATANNSLQAVTISYDDIQEVAFAVPSKDGYLFDGWYLDSELTIKVTDGKGFYYLGYTIFYYDSDCLYAKWIKPEDINATYKVLMVFVDEVQATLTTAAGMDIDVDYKMPLIEQKICELIPKQMEKTINEWFEDYGVIFEFDTYFTTIPLGNEAFSSGYVFPTLLAYSIYAPEIPEVGLLLKNYRNVMTTFNINDHDGLLTYGTGSAYTKYSTTHLETLLKPLVVNYVPLENCLAFDVECWEIILGHYFHEFTHTVEMQFDISIDYHTVEYYYLDPYVWRGEAARLYLLNQAVIDGITVGIPFEFWQGEMDVFVSYTPNAIDEKNVGKVVLYGEPWEVWQYMVSLEVSFGSSITVEAIANEGYRFVRWSDGVTTEIRHDENIISIAYIMAIFEKV